MPIARTLSMPMRGFAASSLTIFDCLHRYIVVDALFFYKGECVPSRSNQTFFTEKK